MESSTQSVNLEQERLQIAQLDAMMISAFKLNAPPEYVREAWDTFIGTMKKWKGIE
jgi:hypothetical protein